MTRSKTIFSLILAVFCLSFSSACGDDFGPSPDAGVKTGDSQTTGDSPTAEAAASDNAGPSFPLCKLDLTKIQAFHLVYSDRLEVEGKAGSVRVLSDILLSTPKGFSEKVRSGLTGAFGCSVPFFGKGPSLGIADGQLLTIAVVNEWCKTASGNITIKAYKDLK